MVPEEVGTAAALCCCLEHNLPLPPWLRRRAAASSINELIGKRSSTKLGRNASPKGGYLEELKHYARWDAVETIREIQKESEERLAAFRRIPNLPKRHLIGAEKDVFWYGKSLEAAFACASVELHKGPGRGGPAAVKKSYRKVKKSMDDGTYRFHLLAPKLLRLLGIQWQFGPSLVRLRNHRIS